jgi:hypothetical protein
MLSKVRVFATKNQAIFVNGAGSARKSVRLLGTVTLAQQHKRSESSSAGSARCATSSMCCNENPLSGLFSAIDRLVFAGLYGLR